MAALGQRGWRLPPFSLLFAAARGSKEGAGNAPLSPFLLRTAAKGGASGAPLLSSSSSGGEEGFGLHSPRRRWLAAVMGDPAAGRGRRPSLFPFLLRWRNPDVEGPQSSSFLPLAPESNMGGVKNGERKCINLPAAWFPVFSATNNGGFRSLPNLNRRSIFFLSGRSLSTSVAIDTNPVGERFKCQHETRGRLCKTLEKRNIWDHKRRLLANKYELRRNLYKAICRDPDLPPNMRDKFRSKLAKLPRNSAFVRVRNRCITTGRPRAVLKMFRMSRIVFREKASQGALMGVKKSSW